MVGPKATPSLVRFSMFVRITNYDWDEVASAAGLEVLPVRSGGFQLPRPTSSANKSWSKAQAKARVTLRLGRQDIQ